MKKQIFLIDHGTYPFDIVVDIGSSDKELHAFLKKNCGYTLSDREKEMLEMVGIGRTVMLEGNQTVLRVAALSDRVQFHQNVAHEIFHAVEFLFNRAGLRHNLDAGEAWAYQIAHITRHFYRNLYKKA